MGTCFQVRLLPWAAAIHSGSQIEVWDDIMIPQAEFGTIILGKPHRDTMPPPPNKIYCSVSRDKPQEFSKITRGFTVSYIILCQDGALAHSLGVGPAI